MDIQEKFLSELANKIGSKKKVAKAIMTSLEISQDSVYRRTRGETQLTIGEIQKLCLEYNISFDLLIQAPDKDQILFIKRDLTDIDYDFNRYLTDMLSEFQKIQDLPELKLTVVAQDLTIFTLFNFPQLTRFKFHIWSQNIIHKKDKVGEKFHLDNMDNDMWNLANNIQVLYSRLNTEEILSPDFLKGLIREIIVHDENKGFNSKKTAITLLESIEALTYHMESECEDGIKKIIGKEPLNNKVNYRCFLNKSYIPDNTLVVESKVYNAVFLTHNSMNFLSTNNAKYVEDTKNTIKGYKRNCERISGVNIDLRKRFFNQIRKTVEEAKMTIAKS